MAHPDTECVHAGEPASGAGGASIVPPISVGSVSTYPDLASLERAMAAHEGYGRWGTENHTQLEAAVAVLEQGNPGQRIAALSVASGMAAIAIAIVTEAGAGDHLVVAHDCYGTTITFVRDDLARLGIEVSIVDVQDLGAVQAAIRDRTRLILCEVATNPLIRVPDLPALAQLAHSSGCLLMVDNTVPTPVLCHPFRWGADVVLHSATKNLSGHADVVGGLVLGRPAWIEEARALARTWGPTLGPFEAWLTLRGVRSLGVRMERHAANALRLAKYLEGNKAIARVHYPCLDSSPFAARARQLLPHGGGALLSFELADLAAVDRLVRRLHLVRLMPSLGYLATTLSHPASTSHRGLSPDERQRAGISEGLVRCSVGLEHPDDLLADFEQALAA